MPYHSLKDLYVEELRDLYDAEHQITRAMPQMIQAASSPELRQAFQTHLEETKMQVERLDLIFKKLGTEPKGKHCKGIEGIIAEGQEVIREGGAPDVADAALIASAQRIEHYEIAAYGSARTFADRLDDGYAADLLQKTLDEEGKTDHLLTGLAEGGINQSASAGKEIRGSRLRYVNAAELPGGRTEEVFRDVKVVGAANDDLGRVDGFVLDRNSGRPYYVVVDSGGWFTGNRYLLPINSVRFDKNNRQMRTAVDKDAIKRYPKFEGDAFESEERSWNYENQLLETYGYQPTEGRSRAFDYERYERIEEFRKPDWWEYERIAPSEPLETGRGAVRSRGSRVTTGETRPTSEPAREFDRPGSEGRSTIDEPGPGRKRK